MTHASLFSGIGGAELAATWAGWTNLFHCEINPFGRRVLEYWFPNSMSYEDITKTDFTLWRGRVDVLTGGFPCQPFSVAGKRCGADDDRYLWPEMLRAIREIQPSWIVGENVAGILSMVQPGTEAEVGCGSTLFGESHLYRTEQQYALWTVCQDLERERYSVQPFVIPACAIGAPHRRDRVWIVARRDSEGCGGDAHGCACGRDGAASDTHSQRREETDISPVAGSEGRPDGHPEDATDTHSKLLQSRVPSRQEGREIEKKSVELPHVLSNWKDFPTQPPVCRRDDGLPFDVDNLTISFPKWRAESIKAYGNAWVPQIAYEIFRSIQEYENKL